MPDPVVLSPTRRGALVSLVILVAVAALVLPAPAAADDETCTGTIGAQTVDGNVIVPDGESCALDGTVVTGNVLVGVGATLDASDASIDGNIQDDNNDAGDVAVTDSAVGGNVQLEQGAGATIVRTNIDGDLQLESNEQALEADGNTIGGNLQANQNTGGLTITDNTIGGNLQCQSNDPAPTGSGNVVSGDAEGQCASLTGDDGDDGDDDDGGSPTPRETGRLAGPNRFATAAAVARHAFPNGADVVYLARADGFADALVAGVLPDGPILLVPACGAVPDATGSAITDLDPRRVVALGGTSAVCSQTLAEAATF